MSGKHWGLGVALTVFFGIVYFFGPILVILVASLIWTGTGTGAHSEDLGSGQNLNVRKIVTPHRGWDTGSAFEVTTYDVLYKGEKVSREKLGNGLTWKISLPRTRHRSTMPSNFKPTISC